MAESFFVLLSLAESPLQPMALMLAVKAKQTRRIARSFFTLDPSFHEKTKLSRMTTRHEAESMW